MSLPLLPLLSSALRSSLFFPSHLLSSPSLSPSVPSYLRSRSSILPFLLSSPPLASSLFLFSLSSSLDSSSLLFHLLHYYQCDKAPHPFLLRKQKELFAPCWERGVVMVNMHLLIVLPPPWTVPHWEKQPFQEDLRHMSTPNTTPGREEQDFPEQQAWFKGI